MEGSEMTLDQALADMPDTPPGASPEAGRETVAAPETPSFVRPDGIPAQETPQPAQPGGNAAPPPPPPNPWEGGAKLRLDSFRTIEAKTPEELQTQVDAYYRRLTGEIQKKGEAYNSLLRQSQQFQEELRIAKLGRQYEFTPLDDAQKAALQEQDPAAFSDYLVKERLFTEQAGLRGELETLRNEREAQEEIARNAEMDVEWNGLKAANADLFSSKDAARNARLDQMLRVSSSLFMDILNEQAQQGGVLPVTFNEAASEYLRLYRADIASLVQDGIRAALGKTKEAPKVAPGVGGSSTPGAGAPDLSGRWDEVMERYGT